MNRRRLLELLEEVRKRRLAPARAARALEWLPYEDLGFARIDSHRELRKAVPEVVFCEGKTVDQAEQILRSIARSSGRALGTRASPALAGRFAKGGLPSTYEALSRTLVLGKTRPRSRGVVGILCAGTSDIPVAEEAARTAEFVGARAVRVYDVGVAGLHRLLGARRAVRGSDALVVAAGMEGALPSVVGGLAAAPVIAVPTSVGYGASFRGLAALLAMMNSCAPGVAVVNIDNGFGAGYLAAVIAGRKAKR